MARRFVVRTVLLLQFSFIPITLFANQSLDLFSSIVATLEEQDGLCALDLPGISHLEMPKIVKDLLLSTNIAKEEIILSDDCVQIETTAWLHGRQLELDAILYPSQTQDANVVLYVPLPDGWKLSDFIPLLEHFDIFSFHTADLFVSNYDHFDQDYEVEIKAGANLVGTLGLAGPLSYLSWLIGDVVSQVNIAGVIAPDVIGSEFTAELPGSISFLGGLELEDLSFTIHVGDSISGNTKLGTIGGELTVEWPGRDPFVFGSEVDLFADHIELSGSMDGMVENLFSIYGLHAGNWFVSGTLEYMLLDGFSSLIPLTDFSMGFDLEFAGRQVHMVSKIGLPTAEGLGDLAFEGTLHENVTLQDCVEFVGCVIEDTPFIEGGVAQYQESVAGSVPDFELGDVRLFFSPKDVEINDVKYCKGLIVDGNATLFGSDAQLSIDIQESGMKIFGYLEELQFGPLKITGPGPDMIMDTPDDGLIFDAVLGLDEQHCFLAGQVEVDIFGGISAQTKIDITSTGLVFETNEDLFDLFEFGLIFSSQFNDTGIPLDFYVKGYMKQEALNALQDLLSKTAYRTALTKMENYYRNKKKLSIFDALSNMYDGFWNVLANLVGNTFNIQEFSFEASLEELVDNTHLPSVTIKGIVLGKEFELTDITFDLSDPISSVQTIVESLAHMFK